MAKSLAVVFFTLVLPWNLFAQVTAQTPRLPDMASEVRELVAQLENGTDEQAKEAQEQLVALGLEVAHHLPVVKDTASEVFRIRLAFVRDALEQVAIDQLSAASLVTIDGEMTLSNALKRIQKQTGNRAIDMRPIYGQAATEVRITADFDKLPYWEAIDRLMDSAGMVIDPNVLEPASIGFVSRSGDVASSSGRAAYSGRFRLEAIHTVATCGLRNSKADALEVAVEVLWEPKSTPLGLLFIPESVEALDQEDSPIAIRGLSGPTEISVHESGASVALNIPFELPEPESFEIATLRGKLIALMPAQVVTFEFSKLGQRQPVTQSKGSIGVTLQRSMSSQNLIDVTLRIRIESKDSVLQSHRGWIYNNPAILIDKEGTEHEYVGMDTVHHGPSEVSISYKFDVRQDVTECRFRYSTPAAVMQVPVPFVLKNIRLP